MPYVPAMLDSEPRIAALHPYEVGMAFYALEQSLVDVPDQLRGVIRIRYEQEVAPLVAAARQTGEDLSSRRVQDLTWLAGVVSGDVQLSQDSKALLDMTVCHAIGVQAAERHLSSELASDERVADHVAGAAVALAGMLGISLITFSSVDAVTTAHMDVQAQTVVLSLATLGLSGIAVPLARQVADGSELLSSIGHDARSFAQEAMRLVRAVKVGVRSITPSSLDQLRQRVDAGPVMGPDFPRLARRGPAYQHRLERDLQVSASEVLEPRSMNLELGH